VGRFPDRQGVGEDLPSFFGEDEDAAAAVGGVRGDFDQAPALQRFERGGEGGTVHGEQVGDGAHGGWRGAVERHEQGELAVGQAEGAQDFVEASSQGTCRTLDVEAKAGIPDEDGGFVRKGLRA